MQVTLTKYKEENYNVRTFYFKPHKPLSYIAGQFIELYLPHDNPDDRGIKRWFTLSSSPSEELFSITTKFAGQKASSFKKTLWQLKPGSGLRMVEPMGDFVLPKDKSLPLTFVAGGIGVTPFRSMVKWLTDTKEGRDIQILLAANQPKDILFDRLFADYGSKLHKIVSHPDKNWSGQVGQLTPSNILDTAVTGENTRIYVSGPEPMVEALEKGLLKYGVKKDQLILDFFPGYKSNLK